ncbi:MAG: putative viral replication protein [Cressdnaviricota sp.]|nr:MAG: putative viral replication protein [Cressdnaviricota sp.]
MPRKKKVMSEDNSEEKSAIKLQGEFADTDKDKGYMFVFTDFNVDKVYELTDAVRGIGWGLETCPTTGRKHLQGFIQVFKQSRFKAIIQLLGGHVWVKVARGTHEECQNYCMKEGAYQQMGCFVKQGQRIQGIVENYEAGNTILDIIENDEEKYLKYHAGIDKIYQHLEIRDNKDKVRKMTNVILWGDSGTGKTTSIEQKHGRENCYVLGNPEGDNKCWNGYDGQKVLILDEYCSWFPLSVMLTMMDGRPWQCRALCKSMYAKFDHIYITMNDDPRTSLYPNVEGEKRVAFFRRVHKCLEVRRGNIAPSSDNETKKVPIQVKVTKVSKYVKPTEFFSLELDYEAEAYKKLNWYERRCEDNKKAKLDH